MPLWSIYCTCCRNWVTRRSHIQLCRAWQEASTEVRLFPWWQKMRKNSSSVTSWKIIRTVLSQWEGIRESLIDFVSSCVIANVRYSGLFRRIFSPVRTQKLKSLGNEEKNRYVAAEGESKMIWVSSVNIFPPSDGAWGVELEMRAEGLSLMHA